MAYQRVQPRTIVCVGCGKTASARTVRAIFCTKSCGTVTRQRERRHEAARPACRECRGDVPRGRWKYCSERCRAAAKAARRCPTSTRPDRTEERVRRLAQATPEEWAAMPDGIRTAFLSLHRLNRAIWRKAPWRSRTPRT